MFIDEWIKCGAYIYTMEYHSAIKSVKMLPFATIWMASEGIMLSEISQTEKRQILYVITYMWHIQNKTHELISQSRSKLIDTENKLVVTAGEMRARKGLIEVGY